MFSKNPHTSSRISILLLSFSSYLCIFSLFPTAFASGSVSKQTNTHTHHRRPSHLISSLSHHNHTSCSFHTLVFFFCFLLLSYPLINQRDENNNTHPAVVYSRRRRERRQQAYLGKRRRKFEFARDIKGDTPLHIEACFAVALARNTFARIR